MLEKSAKSGNHFQKLNIQGTNAAFSSHDSLSRTDHRLSGSGTKSQCKTGMAKNGTQSISFTYNLSTSRDSGEEMPAPSQMAPGQHTKKKRGRPKKSLAAFSAKDSDKSNRRKKPKLSSNPKQPSTKVATKPQTDDRIADLSALTLASEMGYSDPYTKITIKSSGNEKDEEVTKQTSPIEVVQQAIDYKKTCKCTCLSELNIRDIAAHRLEITLLDRQSRDFFVMGFLRCAAVTFKETSRHHDRIRNRFSYRIMNTRICHCCFLMVNNIGGKYLKNLKKHFFLHGVTSRTHGNSGRKPYHAISNNDIDGAIEFVSRYASISGTPAARPPKNPKSKRAIKLPASDNVTSVHKKYKEYYAQIGKRAIALTSFRKVWTRHLPHIKLAVKDPASPAKSQTMTVSGNSQETAVTENHALSGHTTLKRMLNTRRDDTGSSSAPQSTETKIAVPAKPQINVSHEFSSGEISFNSGLPLNMYLADGENQDGIQYSSYLFSPNSAQVSQQLHTSTSSVSPSALSVKSNQVSYSSSNSLQNSTATMAVNPSVIHLPTDTFSSNNLLLLGSNNGLEGNSSQFLMPQLAPKNPVTVYTHNNSTEPVQQSPNASQQTLVGSNLTNLTPQIHMSLYQ